MKSLFLVVCALVALLPVALSDKKVNVTICYEALCPHSIQFITSKLAPIYRDFQPYINIEFIPFGKSKSKEKNGEIKFSCQHGSGECTGNKIQSCALEQAGKNQKAAVEFVNCQMSTRSQKTNECAQKAGLSYKSIMDCQSSEKATQLQLAAEKRTKTLAVRGIWSKITGMISWVPTIVYNETFDKKKSNRSQRNLVQVLCEEVKMVSNKHPSICDSAF